MSSPSTATMIVGEILGPHGVRGECKVEVQSDFAGRFAPGREVWIEGDESPVRILAARPHKGMLLLLLEGYDDRTQVELLRGRRLLVPRAWAAPLPEGEFYSDELVGMQVVTDAGLALGELVDVWWTGANEVYVVDGDLGEVLLPAIAEVVQAIDLRNRQLVVKLLPGLIPELDPMGEEDAA